MKSAIVGRDKSKCEEKTDLKAAHKIQTTGQETGGNRNLL